MADALADGVVAAAGQLVAAALLVMSITGALRWCATAVPVPIVKGIQLGAGLSLIISAGSTLLGRLAWAAPALDNRMWALAAFAALVATQHMPRFPYALVVFCTGLVFALAAAAGSPAGLPHVHVWMPHLTTPSWLSGPVAPALAMAAGQLPLTMLNSIIAVSALSAELLPDCPEPSPTALGLSVAAMNLSGTWFGAMPVCHGSGGLAAQFRFGARSGASVVILGLVKMVAGLVFSDSLADLLARYPRALLGVMVLAAGLELARAGHSLNCGAADLWQPDEEGLPTQQQFCRGRIARHVPEVEAAERWNVMLVTTAGILAFRNDAVGLLAGAACHGMYRLAERAGREGWLRRAMGERTPLL
jgi:hypothetical protein